MDKFLYEKIAKTIRDQILDGTLKPGDRLPSIRYLTQKWNCTPGTIQRAYKQLAHSGIVTSRPGQGTHVITKPPASQQTPLRQAMLLNRTETFLFESLSAGYSPTEIEQSLQIALDRWKTVEQTSPQKTENTILFSGSHDRAITWLANHFHAAYPQFSMTLSFCGSLGGLIALAENKANMAGCHLWDMESDTYNVPFIRRLFPGKKMTIVRLASRHLGLIVASGNPKRISGLSDLARSDVHFINRQQGSGTRVWLDIALQKSGIFPYQIQGYNNEKLTHSDVCRAILNQQVDVGLGLESVAAALGLDFIPLTTEPYDLVFPEESLQTPPFTAIVQILQQPNTRAAVQALGGYECTQTGHILSVP